MAIEIKDNIIPKKYFPDIKHIITYAFSIGEKHYFKFHDAFNIPAERALSTITFYREVELNCDRAYLKLYTEALINCLTPTKEKPSIEVGEALALTRQLSQRLDLPKDTDLMYKLASVVFFDQFENPLVYEYAYGKEKIAYWRQETSLHDFFLQKPILELIPYLQYAGENLTAYDGIMKEVKQVHLQRIQANLSNKPLMKQKS